MKIAVTSSGETPDSQIDPRFGRTAYFLIGESEGDEFEAVNNENVAAAGGAGISSAKLVTDAGVEAVLTGNCGPNAERALRVANIKLYTGLTGTVAEAVTLFRSGKLTEAAGPNVPSHSGVQG